VKWDVNAMEENDDELAITNPVGCAFPFLKALPLIDHCIAISNYCYFAFEYGKVITASYIDMYQLSSTHRNTRDMTVSQVSVPTPLSMDKWDGLKTTQLTSTRSE
jgi:hypothetical protein